MKELKTKEEIVSKKDSKKKIIAKEKLIQNILKDQNQMVWFASILI